MAPSVEYVGAQLEDLYQRLKPVAMAETHRLLELKKKDPANEDNTVSELYEWDKAYYVFKQKEDDISVDYSLLAEYFEVRHTLSEMLDLFRDLFGMEFNHVVASVWHESVICYQVWDTPSEGSGFLGYLYVDLYERDGKYRGAHCIVIQPVSLFRPFALARTKRLTRHKGLRRARRHEALSCHGTGLLLRNRKPVEAHIASTWRSHHDVPRAWPCDPQPRCKDQVFNPKISRLQ